MGGSSNASNLATADAYFAALPGALSGAGGDTPITLAGDYGYYHAIGAYTVGDTSDPKKGDFDRESQSTNHTQPRHSLCHGQKPGRAIW